MGGTRFMVQWEEHPSHLATRLGQLLEHQTLVDVTLMCNTHTLRVHRAVLAACSPYFETILQRQLGMHPLIVLKDMQFSVLKSLIEFMYCGETSVTEDNLGALLQAAKFFQVKGLSAMTKEALGLAPTPKTAVNGESARKAFVGRPKRVGMQQTFVTSGLKPVAAAHASGSHSGPTVVAGELPTLPTKSTFQTISKPVVARPETQQQQTDTAQLLLSLSGSEFPKQTFHTVSKNVRFQHNVPSSAISVEPTRTNALEANIKAKEVVSRIPVVTSNGGAKVATAVSQQGTQIVEHVAATQGTREDVLVSNQQSVYISDNRRRGRPVKRQMNMLLQERMMTDADMALHKEAEASRKALEMLRQEMASDPAADASTAGAAVSVPGAAATDGVQKTLAKPSIQVGTKLQMQPVQTSIATTSRTMPLMQTVASPAATRRVNTNVVYKTATPTMVNAASKKAAPPTPIVSTPEPSSSSVNVTFKVDEQEMPQQVFQLAEEATPGLETPKEEPAADATEYQVAGESAEGVAAAEGEGESTNIVYQMADGSTAAPGSVMSQYMEVLKEAGLPTDVPILLDSGDGSYVTVNEEVLMNIVNGGVLQCHVTEGNIVAGDGVEFIVQEITEDEMEAVQAQVQEQTGAEQAEAEAEVKPVVAEAEEAAAAPAPAASPEVKNEEAGELPTLETANEANESETGEPKDESPSINVDLELKVKSPGYIVPDEVPREDELSNNNNVSQDSYDAAEAKANFDDASERESIVYASSQSNAAEDGVCEELPDSEVKEKPEHEAEMSVEQALEAMMGETSDSELDASQREAVEANKGEDVEADLENIAEPVKEEAKSSEDLQLVLRSEEETQDLRLVLSPEEDVKEEEGRSNEDSNSFAIVLSPGSAADREGGVPAVEEAPEEAETEAEAEVAAEGEPLEAEAEAVAQAEEKAVPTEEQPLPLDGLPEAEAEIVEQAEVETEAGAEADADAPKVEELLEASEGSEMAEPEAAADSQEIVLLTGTTPVPVPAEQVKTKGAVISPSKDIPFAVGLLPLKTALEKLQAMPEYHPRKTRSSSTGKEAGADMPARVKRKASSSEGPDKKMKIASADTVSVVEQGEVQMDGDSAAMEEAPSVPATAATEDSDRAALSMPELVTEPTDG